VVWGKHADYLVSDQPSNYAFGFGSPLDRFLQLEGKILRLGCDHDTATFLHYAEHIVEIPDKRVARFRVPVEADRKRVWREMEEFDTSKQGVHPNWPDRFFALRVDGYLKRKNNRRGRVGNAPSCLFPARELLDFALPSMKSVAADAGAASELRGSSCL
jgi:aminoglycoside 3-N-acetyltransferase